MKIKLFFFIPHHHQDLCTRLTATTIYSRKYYFSLLGVSLAFTIGFHIGDKEIKEKQDQKKIVCNNNYVILRWNSRVHKHSHWNISFFCNHTFFSIFFFRIEKKLNWKIKHWYCVIFFSCDNIFFIIFLLQNSLGIRFQGGFNSKIAVQKHSKFSTGMIFLFKKPVYNFFSSWSNFFTNFFLIFSFRGRLYSLKLCEMNYFFQGGNNNFLKEKMLFFFSN